MVGPWSMTATETAAVPGPPLPRWDVSDVFPSLQSRELATARERLGAGLDRLVAIYDQHGVGECAPHPPSPEEIRAVDAVLEATNETERDLDVLRAFVASYVTTDSRNDAAQGMYSTLERHGATLRQLSARLAAWVVALGPDALATGSP